MFQPAIPFFKLCSKEIHIYSEAEVGTNMFIVTLFIMECYVTVINK